MPGATIIVFLVLIWIAALASQVGNRRKGSYLFAGCPLMSDSEIRFFRVLQMAAPNELVFPQVWMAAIVRPK